MGPAKQSFDNPPRLEAIVKVTTTQAAEEKAKQSSAKDPFVAAMEADPLPLIERINEQGIRETGTNFESKPSVVVIYPDLYQGLLSRFQATKAFQLENANISIGSTAEIAASSPRYRRRSSTFIDGVHDLPDEKTSPMAPAQLYSTMSGRLFHSGRIAIVLVGPPARGKT